MTAFETIEHVADIPTSVSVHLDRITMTIREVLTLRAGSVIKTARAAGENVAILVAGAPIGSGEIVIMEETVGVRTTDFREEG
jgi:flagellar motor switch protein FliN/FliY